MLDFLLGNDPLLGIVAFFIVLIPLILVHELGHFLAAKAVGITVLEFGIGFPPRIVRLFTWRETEFTLNWLPLGGFVRPLGEDMVRPLDEKAVEKDRQMANQRLEHHPTGKSPVSTATDRLTRSVNEASPMGRIVFMSAGAFANFLLAFIIFTLIALSGIPQPIGGSVEVVELQENSMLASSGLNPGDFILDLDGETFQTAADFLTAYYAKSSASVITVQRAESGIREQITLAPIAADAQPKVARYAQIAGIVPDAPGDQAGIQPGDLVVAFNGQPLEGVEQFRELTRQYAGQRVTLTIQRGGDIFDVQLTPRTNPPEGQGAIGIIIWPASSDLTSGLIFRDGFTQEMRIPQPLGQAVEYGLRQVGFVISTTISIPSQLISGALTPDEARPVSIIGVSQIGGVALEQSIQQGRPEVILNFIGMISVALGFFNLLPLPALDGGRILFVLIEIIRGRPIAPEREGLVHLVGLALLLSLSVVIILNDVINPITNMIR